ncbi:Predicted 5' DNA nuclease, flap endonuclease-1-like, helix-3-turn-helix (H3TH) domain [Spirosomataceae bacterium TFI 002]|nr:Predicted 5' DNA nuclease, flap endonuclease-1-like, helix-3-turn-helix (H3TH) domain [Spirosomataceae bacterium TFI 002]
MAKTKVDFILPSEIVGEATSGLLLGEFNNWDYNFGFPLKKQKDGSLKTTISLDAGGRFEYRYLLNDGRWVNDSNADQYVHISKYQIENCVIAVPAAKATATKKVAAPKKTTAPKKAAAPKKVATAAKATTGSDDLTKVEGIGKKIAELLVKDGITTFELLGKSTAAKLKKILATAGPRYSIHVPTTWPKQAKLAAAGKWDELKKLQDELNGGK